MGMWTWEGLDKNGKRARGQINASNEKEVRKSLRAQGVRPKVIQPPSILEFDIGEWMIEKGISQAFGAAELCQFTKQLSIMINAGVPILQSLEILFKQEKNPSLKKSIKSIHSNVGEGKTLAESMRLEKGFDKLYCNLVKAGEAGGILDEILVKLTIHMERLEKTKSQIKSAMTYPIIVFFVGILVIIAMMVFVVPQFMNMLNESGQEVPMITQIVVDASEWFQEWFVFLVSGIFLTCVILNSYRKTPSGKFIFDRVAMNMPIFGGIVVKGNLSSFTRTLSTMLSSGVALVDSLDICIDTIDNDVISKDLKVVREAVVHGKTLTEPLSKIKYFPDMVSQMIRVGEQTGNMDDILTKIADVFEDEVSGLVSNMTKLIEPFILIFLGGFVAVILLAMYMPIFQSAGGSS